MLTPIGPNSSLYRVNNNLYFSKLNSRKQRHGAKKIQVSHMDGSVLDKLPNHLRYISLYKKLKHYSADHIFALYLKLWGFEASINAQDLKAAQSKLARNSLNYPGDKVQCIDAIFGGWDTSQNPDFVASYEYDLLTRDGTEKYITVGFDNEPASGFTLKDKIRANLSVALGLSLVDDTRIDRMKEINAVSTLYKNIVSVIVEELFPDTGVRFQTIKDVLGIMIYGPATYSEVIKAEAQSDYQNRVQSSYKLGVALTGNTYKKNPEFIDNGFPYQTLVFGESGNLEAFEMNNYPFQLSTERELAFIDSGNFLAELWSYLSTHSGSIPVEYRLQEDLSDSISKLYAIESLLKYIPKKAKDINSITGKTGFGSVAGSIRKAKKKVVMQKNQTYQDILDNQMKDFVTLKVNGKPSLVKLITGKWLPSELVNYTLNLRALAYRWGIDLKEISDGFPDDEKQSLFVKAIRRFFLDGDQSELAILGNDRQPVIAYLQKHLEQNGSIEIPLRVLQKLSSAIKEELEQKLQDNFTVEE